MQIEIHAGEVEWWIYLDDRCARFCFLGRWMDGKQREREREEKEREREASAMHIVHIHTYFTIISGRQKDRDEVIHTPSEIIVSIRINSQRPVSKSPAFRSMFVFLLFTVQILTFLARRFSEDEEINNRLTA